MKKIMQGGADMAGNILYIQSNEKIAQSFQETFRERGIELLVAPSAQDAFVIMREQEVGLLLVDINIPDMRLSKLVEICSRDFPTVIMNVCVDVLNSLLVTKLVNRHAIHKIFVAPWDVKEMIEEIEESLDAAEISREQVLFEKKIVEENEQFQNTLHSLTDALKKQQYSYNTIRRVTDVFFENIVHLQELQDEESRSQAAVLKQIFDMYLRMQTTESLPLERFEEIVRSDFDKLAKQAEGMELGEVHSCLTGDVQRTMAVNIRFAVWLILYTCLGSKITASVTSGYITVKEVKFIVTLQGEKKKIPFREQYLSECLHTLTKSCEIKENGSETVYDLTFIPVEQH